MHKAGACDGRKCQWQTILPRVMRAPFRRLSPECQIHYSLSSLFYLSWDSFSRVTIERCFRCVSPRITHTELKHFCFSDGRLLEGDQILAIDGQPLDSNISHEQAISILQKARGLVELVVARSTQGNYNLRNYTLRAESAYARRWGLLRSICKEDEEVTRLLYSRV